MSLFDELKAANSAPPARQSTITDQSAINLSLGAPAKRNQAHERYREVMENAGWLTQRDIEKLLSYHHGSATHTLYTLLDLDMIERRLRFSNPKSRGRNVFEYRWISTTP